MVGSETDPENGIYRYFSMEDIHSICPFGIVTLEEIFSLRSKLSQNSKYEINDIDHSLSSDLNYRAKHKDGHVIMVENFMIDSNGGTENLCMSDERRLTLHQGDTRNFEPLKKIVRRTILTLELQERTYEYIIEGFEPVDDKKLDPEFKLQIGYFEKDGQVQLRIDWDDITEDDLDKLMLEYELDDEDEDGDGDEFVESPFITPEMVNNLANSNFTLNEFVMIFRHYIGAYDSSQFLN